jgi:hypothetical protein
MCETNTAELFNQTGKTQSKPERNGMAEERHGNGMVCVIQHLGFR